MALGSQLPILDLQSTGTGRASGARNGAGSSSGSSGFEQLLSQRMQGGEPSAPAPSQRPADTSRQVSSESRKPEQRPDADSRRPESVANKDTARETSDKAEHASARETESEDEPDQNGKDLPPEVAGLPLFLSVNLPQPGMAGSFQPAGQDSFVNWMQGNLQASSGDLADATGLEEFSLDGLDLDSLSLGEEGLKLNALSVKGELADTKLQLQTFSSVAPLAATAHREPQVSLSQYSTSIQTPVHDAKWGEQMVNKVLWLTSQSIRSAEIHLNPADLGPLEVKIQINQDQATVQVQAQNAGVREALEQNVHRLREALAGSGLDLAGFDVSSQAGQQQAQEQQGAQHVADTGTQTEAEPESPVQALETGLPGLVNTYA